MKKQHYHLVSGSVMFIDSSDGTERAGNFVQNATLRTPTKDVPAAKIGEAQKALQMLMWQKLEDPTLTVTDVHIHSLSYLGYMTEDEFLKPAEAEMPSGPTPIDPRLQ